MFDLRWLLHLRFTLRFAFDTFGYVTRYIVVYPLLLLRLLHIRYGECDLFFILRLFCLPLRFTYRSFELSYILVVLLIA